MDGPAPGTYPEQARMDGPERRQPRRSATWRTGMWLAAVALPALAVAWIATAPALVRATRRPAAQPPVAALSEGFAPGQVVVDVTARDDVFEPLEATVPVGGVVRWTNRGQHPHSTTSDTGLWNWSLVPGASFGLRFLAPGTYRYHCVYHRSAGMSGTIHVTGGGPLPSPTPGPGPGPAGPDTIVYDYYADDTARTLTDLLLVEPGGGDRRALTTTPDWAEAQPSWSPDRGRVAYSASRYDVPGAPWSLWLMDLASGERRQISSGPEHYEPDWRPDGSLLVFTSIGRTNGIATSSEIAVIAPNGGYHRPLIRMTSTSYGLVNPSWSPDGQHIAFSLGSNLAGGELYAMRADGRDARPVLSHPGWDDIDPEWSPDGRYLAFAAGRLGAAETRHDIWLLELATGRAGMVAEHPEWDLRRPAWSPDGSRLVFTARYARQPASWALYVVPATGGTVSGPLASGVEPDWGAGAALPPVTPPPPPTGTAPAPPTPPPFPTLPSPEPTDPGPPPTFPPPEPTSTSWPPPPTVAPPSATAPGTPGVVGSRVYLPQLWATR